MFTAQYRAEPGERKAARERRAYQRFPEAASLHAPRNGIGGYMVKLIKAMAITGVLIMGIASLIGCALGKAGGDPESSDDSSGAAGTYTVEPGRRITGAERHVRLSREGVVSWSETLRHDPLDGDGMAESVEVYTFTAVAPGEVDVQIYDILAWTDGEQVEDAFRLVVGSDLSVTRVETPEVERFELRESGSMAGWRVYEGVPGDAGFMLVSIYWEDYDGNRSDERSLLVSPREIGGVFIDCDVASWDGFTGSDPHVLDGYSFSFEATLSDGTTISASGSNASPQGYPAFKTAIGRYLGM